MPVRVRYAQEYLRVREKLDRLAILALEIVEDEIARDPDVGHHRRQIRDGAVFDYSAGEGDILVRYRRIGPNLVEFEKVKDLRNPDI